MRMRVCTEITERGQSQAKDGRRFRGAAVVADRLVEIKELKIDTSSRGVQRPHCCRFF